VAQYADWRAKPLGKPVDLDDLDREGARAIMDAALRGTAAPEGKLLVGSSHAAASTDTENADAGPASTPNEGRWLTTSECQALLQAYGVPLARARIVATADEAADVHREFGGTVAVKLAAPIHKTDVGGIALGLTDPAESAAAVRRMDERLAALGMSEHAGAYMVQEMVDDGVEMVVGVTHDPSFGPLVMTGMGGTLVELLRDVSVRITPLTDRDADEMLASLRMRPLLEGYRGSPPADVPALKQLLHRIAAMVEDLPEIAELDLNPVFVRPEGQGVVAVDMRMKVTPAP
jgi:acyl-CoA synthetase (NDP forming)